MKSGTPEIKYGRMKQAVSPPEGQDREFLDRRTQLEGSPPDEQERRQFPVPRQGLSPEGGELAAAIDSYKLSRDRRQITVDELLEVMKSLGYQK